MTFKPKKNQPETPTTVQTRDRFFTPAYAVDMIVPFLDKTIPIWECAAGTGMLSKRLLFHGFKVFSSDLLSADGIEQSNFLFDSIPGAFGLRDTKNFMIVTNPPYSLKEKFYQKCLSYGVPFALLIPADYSAWIINAIRDGAEKVVPTRRVDYIAPNVLSVIYKDQLKKIIETHTKTKYKDFDSIPEHVVYTYRDCVDEYASVDEVPNAILKKYSAAKFHSMWMTHGLGIGKSETFVDLSLAEKENIL